MAVGGSQIQGGRRAPGSLSTLVQRKALVGLRTIGYSKTFRGHWTLGDRKTLGYYCPMVLGGLRTVRGHKRLGGRKTV